MNKQNFKNGLNKFPVSTDALDFMQEQINFVATLTDALGANVIIKQSSSSIPGLVVVNGELLPLQGTPQGYITIQEESQSVTAKGETFANARIIRIAKYTSNSYGSTSFKAVDFAQIDNVAALTLNQRQYVPKGTIIDWYGEAAFDNIPYGWVPCGYFYQKHGGDYAKNIAVKEVLNEAEKWKSAYPDISTETICHYLGESFSFLRITKVGQMTIPNLSGRFIVGAGYSGSTSLTRYKNGDTGGEEFHRLTAEESGLPAHTHDWQITQGPEGRSDWGANSTLKGSEQEIGGSRTGLKHIESGGGGDEFVFNQKQGGSWGVNNNPSRGYFDILSKEIKVAQKAHENRPPYFALYKLIKVI